MGSSHLILEKNNSGDGLLLAEISFGDILKVMWAIYDLFTH